MSFLMAAAVDSFAATTNSKSTSGPSYVDKMFSCEI